MGIEKEYKISKERRDVYKTIGGTPHLDTQYTIFGEVVKGIEIVDKIASVKTDKNAASPLAALLFSITDLSRQLGLQAEILLREENNRFEQAAREFEQK